ncbi:MAG: fibrobacter succinogenes major paralogous domain-containing protein [Fibrobacter sp.]|uniref:fibrobacter succinogenes major paralogous domain-containing protein n=1 Tax=Fibrobacter sp. TaxID=35828 RepID=UPI0025BDFB5C|nr:fibrobacter succinogenes major paralogous domain-containing protein [Fibrobacter sp.]MBR4784510.1 fibrobacter succinogenes major paralogous domain-containing protein [Fibrobacter sp.]
MKRSLYTVFACTAFLVACGDDDSFTPKVPELPGEVADMDELKEFECNDDLIGKKVYVKDLETDYECDGDHWFEAVDTGKSSSSSKKTSSSSAKSSSSAESSSSEKSSSSAESSSSGKSSSSETSVSSSAKSSSSYTTPLLSHCDIGTDENCFKDARDGQTYRTVKIGNQVWMRDNLNFRTGSSSCYNDDTSFCTKYGLLYTWATALDSVGEFSTNSKGCGYNALSCRPVSPTYGICPDGWRIPSTIDWSILFGKVGGKDVAGKALKSASDWLNDGNGTDEASFTALPGGRFEEGIFYLIGNDASFWASNPNTTTYVRLVDYVAMSDDLDKAAQYQTEPYNKRYIRCIKIDTTQTASSSSITPKSSSSETSVSSEALSSSSEASSSSVESSSSESSSSSVALATPCKTATEDNCEYGSLTDERDGKTYKTVKIGEQVWMAENLNYAYLQPTETMDSSSFCYKDNASNCDKFGRLYLWSAIIDSTRLATDANNPKDCGFQKECDLGKIQGICPDGWHIPTNDEFKTLMAAVGGDSIACKMLKSTSGWSNYGSGTDPFGFTALPGNIRFNDGTFNYENEYAQFWSTREFSKLYGNTLYLFTNNKNAYISVTQKNYAVSLRCIKD